MVTQIAGRIVFENDFSLGPKAAEYEYRNGIHDFTLCGVPKFVRVGVLKKEVEAVMDFVSKATCIRAGDPYPPTISYLGRWFFHPQIAVTILSAQTPAEREQVCRELGMVQQGSVYLGPKAVTDILNNPKKSGVNAYGRYPEGQAPAYLPEGTVYLGPKAVTDFLNDFMNLTRTSLRPIKIRTLVWSFLKNPWHEKRRRLIVKKYLDGESLTADEMEVLKRDWEERFYRGITDEYYGRRKIIRIPRDKEDCLDWCFPMPNTGSEWKELAEGLGISVDKLMKLATENG